MSAQDTDMTLAIDAEIRALYKANTGGVDMERFTGRLRNRLASARKRRTRRSPVRKLSLVAVGLVLAAGIGVGTWQAVEHLGQREQTLLIGDSSSSTAEVGSQFTFETPTSLAEFSFAGLWNEAAAACGIDPSGARLNSLEMGWSAEGTLTRLSLSASTPEGRAVYLNTRPAADGTSIADGSGLAKVDCSVGLFQDDSEADSGPAVPVDQVLAAIDGVDLMAITEMTGLSLSLDQAPDQGMDPSMGAPDSAGWSLFTSYGGMLMTRAATEYLAEDMFMTGIALGVAGGGASSIQNAEQLSDYLPGLMLSLGREWLWTSAGGASGGPEASVLLSLPETGQGAGGAAVQPQPADEQLDGLVFKSWEAVVRVQSGTLEPIVEAEYGTAFSYSQGRTLLLSKPENGESITALPTDGSQASQELLPAGLAANVSDIRYDENADRIWYSTLYSLSETAQVASFAPTLWTAQPHTTEPAAIPLESGFTGEFDVSADGSQIVYIGSQQGRTAVVLRTGDEETALSVDLATVHNPVFSPDGKQICLVGAEQSGGDSALWVYDLENDDLERIDVAQGLYPTHAVFSPDGQRIAFRGWKDGYLWTVDVKSGELNCYTFTTEGMAVNPGDAPLVW
jgi:hypothetical protein